MIFRELVLQNFGAYLGRQFVVLETGGQGSSQPIVLIGGMNGGGKTTLMDALRLALYGQRAQCSARGRLSYAEFLVQCVNRSAPEGENACIELTFLHFVDNKKPVEFRLVRTWTRHLKTGRDMLDVYVDGIFDLSLAKAWDQTVEDILPLGISNLFLFDGEQVKDLAEFDAPPPSVTGAIRSLLGLELPDRLLMDLEVLAARKRKALANADALQNLEREESLIEELDKERRVIDQRLGSLQQKMEFAEEVVRLATENFVSQGGQMAAQKVVLEQELAQMNQKVQTHRATLREIAAGTLPLAFITPLLERALVRGNREADLKKFVIAGEVLADHNRRLLALIDSLDLSVEQISRICSFLEQESLQFSTSAEAMTQGIPAATLSVLSHTLSLQLPSQAADTRERIDQLGLAVQQTNQLERHMLNAASPEAYEHLAEAIKVAQAKLTEISGARQTTIERLESIKQQIDAAKKNLTSTSEAVLDLNESQHTLHQATVIKVKLLEFRERLKLRKLNQLENLVTQSFLYLLHKPNLVHRVQIDIDTFALSLFDFDGQPIPKNRLSAGEKQLLAIAFLWGLARASGRKLPVAIDTPLGRLDSSHRANLVERYFPNASHQVILLSTDSEISALEVSQLRKEDVVVREYCLKYESSTQRTVIHDGYFW
jgi:DNA sulfur modification protein DndD